MRWLNVPNMRGVKYGERKSIQKENKLRKYHNKGAKVDKSKKSARKEPFFKNFRTLAAKTDGDREMLKTYGGQARPINRS